MSLVSYPLNIRSVLCWLCRRQEAGVGVSHLTDEDALFTQAERTIDLLKSRGLGEEVSISLASVEAGIQAIESSGVTKEEMLEAVYPQLSSIITVLSGGDLIMNDEITKSMCGAVILLMNEKGVLFTEALLSVVEKRKIQVDGVSAVEGYISEGGVVMTHNPNTEEGRYLVH